MGEESRVTLDSESLTTLLRSNLSCHLGEVLTKDVLDEITWQIIESIAFVLNKK